MCSDHIAILEPEDRMLCIGHFSALDSKLPVSPQSTVLNKPSNLLTPLMRMFESKQRIDTGRSSSFNKVGANDSLYMELKKSSKNMILGSPPLSSNQETLLLSDIDSPQYKLKVKKDDEFLLTPVSTVKKDYNKLSNNSGSAGDLMSVDHFKRKLVFSNDSQVQPHSSGS
jgi:hypothetical protein